MRARTIRGCTAVGLACGMLALFTAGAPAAEKVVDDLKVVIPFSGPWGSPPPADMRFTLPAGTYYITLQVDRASWDAPGIADAIPIGIGAYGVNKKGRYNEQPWQTGLGFVATVVYITQDSSLHVVFSTSAPLGARGILNIVRRG